MEELKVVEEVKDTKRNRLLEKRHLTNFFQRLAEVVVRNNPALASVVDAGRQFHGTPSIQGRRKHAGDIRRVRKHQRYRKFQKSLRR